MPIPPIIRDNLALLDESADPLAHLGAAAGLEQWLKGLTPKLIAAARRAGHTWEEIAGAQDRPRQTLHRALVDQQRESVQGLTSPEFDGIGNATLRFWLKWWSDPRRDPAGAEERGRDPEGEQAKLLRELEAREQSRSLKREIDGIVFRGGPATTRCYRDLVRAFEGDETAAEAILAESARRMPAVRATYPNAPSPRLEPGEHELIVEALLQTIGVQGGEVLRLARRYRSGRHRGTDLAPYVR